jgi:hypothetical protein
MKNFRLILVLAVFALLLFFRPWFHGTFIYFYKNPLIIQSIVIAAIFVAYGSIRVKKKKAKKPNEEYIFKSLVMSSFVPVLFAILILSQALSSLIAPMQLTRSLEYENIEKLPQSRENLRLMPMEVAYRYAKDSLQLPQYKLGNENIANMDGTLSWQFPLVPDGPLLSLLLKNKGIVYVDGTVQEKNSEIVEKYLEIGEGMQIFDNLKWNILKKKYRVDLDDTYYILKEDEVYTVIPAIGYDFRLYYGLLYTIPRFEGLFVLDSKGKIDFLKPDEALESELFKNNRIFPENLARSYVESYALKDGIVNYILIHEDQIEIQDIPGSPQPFLIDTSEGLKWFISAEPYGQSHGIFKIFMIDARTGKIELLELALESTLTGPVKATEFVRRENPQVDWTRFKIVEPLPMVRDDRLYWKVVVIPYGAAGIAYQAFIDAQTNDVIELRSDEEIRAFAFSGEVIGQPQEPSDKETLISQIQQKLAEIGELLNKLKE